MKRSAPPRMPSRAIAISRAAPVAWPPRAATAAAVALAGALCAARPSAVAGAALASLAAATGTAWLLAGWLNRRAGR